MNAEQEPHFGYSEMVNIKRKCGCLAVGVRLYGKDATDIAKKVHALQQKNCSICYSILKNKEKEECQKAMVGRAKQNSPKR